MDRDPRWLDQVDRAMTLFGLVVVAIAIGFFGAHIVVHLITRSAS